jgi:glycosyltransferase involved in cell wall biosynthesis
MPAHGQVLSSRERLAVTKNPFFSVVLSTYGRGVHIKPTIESVLGQTFSDFELFVVGDGCLDDTEAAVRSFPPERMTWLNLSHNTGSQSFPNNEGIRASQGQWIAYIGHDDIWAPNHLDRVFLTITSADPVDFAVSGCVFHGPKGGEFYLVTGIFDTPDAPFQHFFPPTSITHRRDVTKRIGEWRAPRALKAPVDVEFLLRAAHGGLRFVSTGKITVHKFAAGHRYLSYLRVSSDEQRECLHKLTSLPGIDIDEIISTSKKNNTFMTIRHRSYFFHPKGYQFEKNRSNKGISRPALEALRGRVVIKQSSDARGQDWYKVERKGKRYRWFDPNRSKRYRWSGPNPWPKILIPYTGHRARITIEVIARNPDKRLEELSLLVEGRPANHSHERDNDGLAHLVADIPLQSADYTVLTLHAPTFRPRDLGLNEDDRLLGIAVGDMVLEPI